MADAKQTDTTQNDSVSVGQMIIETEQQALTAYYEMLSYPTLNILLTQHKNEIARAIQEKDINSFITIIQKVQSDFSRSEAENPYQIQLDTEKKRNEARPPAEELSNHIKNVEQALAGSHGITQKLHANERKKNKDFIGRLVKNYTTIPPTTANQFTDEVISSAESHPDISPREIIQKATKTIPQISPDAIRELQKQKDVLINISRAQKNDPIQIEQTIIRAIIDSPDPMTTIQALQFFGTTNTPIDISQLVKQAQTLATANASIQTMTDKTVVDYSGFFSNLSKNGTSIEKLLAPLANTIFATFPQVVQEKIIFRILGSSWQKDISNNTFLTSILGPSLQSSYVQEAIIKGSQLFAPSGQKNIVLSRGQAIFSDIFTTIFHPQVSEVYLQLAGLGGAQQMGKSVGHFYLGLLAEKGVTYIAKRGVTTIGETAAQKTVSKSFEKFIAGVVGGGGGPIISFLANTIFKNIIGGLWKGVKKGFGFLTNWTGQLVSGNYEVTPLTKDPAFIASAVVVGTITLLFVIPILPFTLTENSLSQQTIQDNAYIQGIGTGDETGPAINCVDDPTNPLCSMKSCDSSQQDCRWPTSGTITQGPYTSCGGTHSNANAIDIGTTTGTDVYATIKGVVTDVFVDCEDNEGSLGNICGFHSGIHKYLGNHIVIQGTGAYTYTLTFGHLLSTSVKVTKGQVVSPTDVIAEVDHSGSSSGPHLHFSFIDNSGQKRSINSILPFAIDHCVNRTDGCSPCSYPVVGG